MSGRAVNGGATFDAAWPEHRPLVVISCDGHIGPMLKEQLRPYCPRQYLGRFDEFVTEHRRAQEVLSRPDAPEEDAHLADHFRRHRNARTAGHHDVGVRLRDMDIDGVAAELIWHFSQNGEPLPWAGPGLGTVTPEQFEMAAVGYGIYNRWLADACSLDPERLIGLVYLPMWDVDASIQELRWARGAGLRVVNFPPPGRPGVPPYNSLIWEPFLVDQRGPRHGTGHAFERR